MKNKNFAALLSVNIKEPTLYVVTIVLLSLGSFARVWTINGTLWDDNAWLMSIYTTHGLNEFLDTSFTEMRRVPLGVFLYPLFWLHKHTDLYFVAWHSLNTITQVATPLILYATCWRLFGNRLLAFFMAAVIAAIYLDQTLAYASAINYRMGLLLGIVSFYFTVRALQGGRSILFLLVSLVTAAIAYMVFMEAVVALEPGRFLVMAYLVNRDSGKRGWSLCKTAASYWSPFVVACVPFALYKLIYRSYGLYAGVYEPDFLFLFDGSRIVDVLAYVFLFQWVISSEQIATVSAWSIVLGAASFFTLALLLIPMRLKGQHVSTALVGSLMPMNRAPDSNVGMNALRIGIVLLLLPLMFFQFFRRPITWGLSSSHGAIAQFGYAIVVGSILYMLFKRAARSSFVRLRVAAGFTVLLFSLGVFYNNLNLDLCQDSHRRQAQFWKNFVARLPSLPAGATFLFDVKDGTIYSPMYYYYYEFFVNLLYAENSEPEDFRRFRVTTFYEMYWQNKIKDDSALRKTTFTRGSLWGEDQINPDDFIWVYHDGSQLLLNEEIVTQFPGSPYRLHMKKPVPQLPPQTKSYPYRYKVLGGI